MGHLSLGAKIRDLYAKDSNSFRNGLITLRVVLEANCYQRVFHPPILHEHQSHPAITSKRCKSLTSHRQLFHAQPSFVIHIRFRYHSCFTIVVLDCAPGCHPHQNGLRQKALWHASIPGQNQLLAVNLHYTETPRHCQRHGER